LKGAKWWGVFLEKALLLQTIDNSGVSAHAEYIVCDDGKVFLVSMTVQVESDTWWVGANDYETNLFESL